LTQSPVAISGDVRLFEGARLIIGDDSNPIENSAFIVEGNKIGRVGRKGEIELPAGATRVDLTGKTVMPALVSTHGHIGLLDGMTFGPEVYTHDKIVEHLQRQAYYGVGALLSPGTDVGPLSFQIRQEEPKSAARLLTAGRGMAAPDGGPGIPSIANTSFPITSADEGRARVQELAKQGANAVKIWVDDRGGRVKKLTPDIYRPIIEEAHKHRLMAVAHVFYLKDAHDLVDAGIDGFMHLVRDEVMDDQLIAAMKQKNVFADANIGGSRRAGLDEAPADWLELLAESVPADVIEQYKATFVGRDPKAVAAAKATYERMAKSLAKLSAAGVTVAFGGDTGIPGAWHGWAEQYELETMVAAGMTPAQVIVSATSASARVLKLDDLGTIAAGKSADFLVLGANPLDDIMNTRRISAVYLRGQAIDRPALRTRWTGTKSSGQN
jgi:imidazolonepropionase-like amidohydrolase